MGRSSNPRDQASVACPSNYTAFIFLRARKPCMMLQGMLVSVQGFAEVIEHRDMVGAPLAE